MIIGKILKARDNEVLIGANIPYDIIAARRIREVEIIMTDGRKLSAEQRKHIYATFRDISLYTGHTVEELKDIFKADYVAKTGAKWFSLSDVDMTTAKEFLQHMLDFCLEYGVPAGLDSTLLERSPDIARFCYKALAERKCVLCGQKSDVHHFGESKVGMGRNRNTIHHFGLQAISLCRKHHTEIHGMAENEFMDKYHIVAIRLDEYLCKKLSLKI